MAMSRRAKKRLVILVVAAAGLAVAFGGAVTLRKVGRARAVEQARGEGIEALEAGRYFIAADRLGRYVARNRDDGEMVLKFVEARRRAPMANARHLLIAAQYANEAVTLLPGDPRPLEALMSMYGELGFLTEYLETADRLLAIDPENAEAHVARVTGLAAQGEVTRSIEAAQAFAKIHPDDWRAHAAVIDLMRRRGDAPEEVLAYIDGVASTQFEDMNVAIQQARAAVLARKMPEARSAADRAASLRIPDAETLGRLVSLLDALGERDRATSIIEREVGTLGDEAHLVAIDRAWKDGRSRDAVEFVRQAIEGRDLDDVDADIVGWGAFIATAGDAEVDADLAQRLRDEVREREGDDASSWAALLDAERLMREGDLTQARERLDFARTVGRVDIAEFILGQADMRVGDRRGAIARWRGVIERDPRWVAARLALATALLEDGELREAHGAAIEALRLAPDRVLIAQMFARTTAALADADMPDAESTRIAIEALGRIIDDERLDPGSSLALLARLKAADGDRDGAQEIIDRILRERPALSAGDTLALASTIERRNLRGGEALLSGAGDVANNPAVLFARAMKAAADGRVDEGKALLRDAINGAPPELRGDYARAMAQFLDATNDPTALDAMRSLSETYAQSPGVQRDVLRSTAAWTDPELVKAAIGNLRAVVGEQSPAWRVFEARRLLTFRPKETARSGGDPTTANAAEVVLMLANVVRLDPGDVQAAALLSEAHLLLNERDRAINALSAAVTANPGEPTLYPRLVALLQEKGDTAAAEQRLRDFLRIRDVSPEIRRARADLLLAQGMVTEALPELEQLAQDGAANDLARLAIQYGRLGRTEEARRLFERLETIESPTVTSALAVAEYRLATGEVDRAMAAIDRLGDDTPESRKMLLRADLLERADRVDEARALYERAAQEQASGEAWLALARFYVRQGQPTEAKRAADRAYAASPNDPMVRSLVKGLALATGEAPPAGLEDTRADVGSSAEMRTLAAIQALRDKPGEVDAYISNIRAVMAEYPRYFPARRLLVMAYAERGDWDNAVAEARDAARVLPIDAQPSQLLTEVYAARSVYEDQRGLQEAQKQYAEQALAAAREWRKRSLSDPFDADVAIADLQDRLGNAREAIRTLEPYEDRLNAAGIVVAPLRTRLFAKTGQLERAEGVVTPMASTAEEWAIVHAEAARHLTNDAPSVRAWLARSERYVGASVPGRLTVAQGWYDLSLRTNATSDRAEVVRIIEGLSPQERAGGGALLLATVYELLGKPEDAERVYRDALSVIPDEPITLNNLSYLLSTRGVSLDEAVEFGRRAVDNAAKYGMPTNQRANFIDTLGTALMRAGRFGEAAQAFRSGLALEPTNRLLMIGLAESLLEEGNREEAQRWMTQLMQTAPVRVSDDPLADRLQAARARLESSR